MRGLAHYFRSLGVHVAGSDLATTGHKEENIQTVGPKPDLVIISAAITPESAGWVEVEEAKRQNIPVKDRAWLIGKLMRQKNTIGIAVAGMHGKSTTTAMIGKILVEAELDPLILCGAIMPEYGDSVKIPKSKTTNYIVAEACEYEKQFLQFSPQMAVVTNIDKEHLDTYPKGLPQIIRTFRDFIKLTPPNGLAVVNGDDKNVRLIAKSARCRVKFFSAKHIWPGLHMKVIGGFNRTNATAAAYIAHELAISSKVIQRALNDFSGVVRRLEFKGESVSGARIYDDYGHHPTEVQATLKALKEAFPKHRLLVVFQPHQFIRTRELLQEFRDCFFPADQIFIVPIYEVAGRDNPSAITLEEFANTLAHPHKMIVNASYHQIAEKIAPLLNNESLLLTIGATPIYKVGELLIKPKYQNPNRLGN